MLSVTLLNAANLHNVLVLDLAPVCQIQQTIFSTKVSHPPAWRLGEEAGKEIEDALPTNTMQSLELELGLLPLMCGLEVNQGTGAKFTLP